MPRPFRPCCNWPSWLRRFCCRRCSSFRAWRSCSGVICWPSCPCGTLFALLPRLLLAVLRQLVLQLLVQLVGLVHELLLLLEQLAELVHLLAHRTVGLLAALHAAGLQVVHHLLQLRQELLGLLALARTGEVLDLVHHAFQILLAQHVLHVVRQARHLPGVLHGLLGHLLQEIVHRLAQLLHQALDLRIRGVVLQRFGERALRIAQALLGERQVAVFEAERDLPEIVGGITQHVVVARQRHALARGPQKQVMGRVADRLFRRRHQRVGEIDGARQLVGVEGEGAALLDDGPRQRIGEIPLGQPGDDRLAAALLAGAVRRHERDPAPAGRPAGDR